MTKEAFNWRPWRPAPYGDDYGTVCMHDHSYICCIYNNVPFQDHDHENIGNHFWYSSCAKLFAKSFSHTLNLWFWPIFRMKHLKFLWGQKKEFECASIEPDCRFLISCVWEISKDELRKCKLALHIHKRIELESSGLSGFGANQKRSKMKTQQPGTF